MWNSKMATHTVAAAQCCLVWLFLYVSFLVLCTFCQVNSIYIRHDLLKIGVFSEWSVTSEFLHTHKIRVELVRSFISPSQILLLTQQATPHSAMTEQ